MHKKVVFASHIVGAIRLLITFLLFIYLRDFHQVWLLLFFLQLVKVGIHKVKFINLLIVEALVEFPL